MKKVLFVFMMAAITLGAALSCSKEIDNPGKDSVPESEDVTPQEPLDLVTWTFTAGVENAETKVGPMADDNSFAWEDNDEIKVLYDGGSTTCNASVSEGVATFSPSIPEGISTIYLVYPSSATASLNGNNLVVNMPEAQKGSLAGYFVAKADMGDETVQFIHPVCYYKFVVDGDGTDVTRLTLTSAANTIDATSVAVDFSGSEPAVSASAEGASSITYDFSGADTYYIPFIPVATEANDLTFQFYRGENKDEKAGGIQYEAALDNARGSIVNWAGLPAMATNRYVSTTGSDSNNGATSEKPWSFAKFSAFWRASDNSELYDGINIRFADGTYDFPSNLNRGDTEVLNLIGESRENTIFKGGNFNHFYANGKTFTVKNIQFTGSTRLTESGGVLVLNGCIVSIDNCIFKGNHITGANCGGGALFIYGSSKVTVTDSEFSDNSCAGGNCIGGGAIYTYNTAEVHVENCKFTGNHTTGNTLDYNKEMGGAVCVQSTGVNSFNKCLFKDNYATQAGAITLGSNGNKEAATVYMNDCVFTGNYITYRYGTTIYSYTNCNLYMHNCNIADDTYAGGANNQCTWMNLKCAKLVMSNCTLIGTMRTSDKSESVTSDTACLVRFDGQAGTHGFSNCLIIATNPTAKAIWTDNASIILKSWGSKYSGVKHNKSSASFSGYNGTYNAMQSSYLAGLTWTAPASDEDCDWNNCYWSWTGKDETWTTSSSYMKVADLPGKINEADGDKNNDCGFTTWLKSIDAMDKDCRDYTRPTSTAPGAFDYNGTAN